MPLTTFQSGTKVARHGQCQVPVPVLRLGSGTCFTPRQGFLGGVGSAGSSAGVGEGTVFTGSIMTCTVGTYEMFPNTDLDRVTNNGDLNLATLVLRAGVIVLPSKTHVP
jgi:hypothetical protein